MANAYITEAFKRLNMLDEDVFDVTDDGIQELKDFEDDSETDETVDIIDPEAENEEELEDSYVGKVILDCCVCHSKIYKNKEEVHLSDDETIANADEECPYCYSTDGYKVIGEVAEFSKDEEEKEDEGEGEEEVEVDDEVEVKDEEEVEESVKKTRKSKSLKEGLKKRSLKESWGDVYQDLIDRAESWIDDGYELEEAVNRALDDGLIYTDDIIELGVHYGVIDGSQVVNDMYEDLFNDIYGEVSDYYDEAHENDDTDESLKKKDCKNGKCKEAVSKRDDIDAEADNKKEMAKKAFARAKDDADADRDYRLKKGITRKDEACKGNKCKSLKEGEELDRELFVSLVKLHPYGYSILNDGNFVKRVYAETDDDAIKQFRDWIDKGGMSIEEGKKCKNESKLKAGKLSSRGLKESREKKVESVGDYDIYIEFSDSGNSTHYLIKKGNERISTADTIEEAYRIIKDLCESLHAQRIEESHQRNANRPKISGAHKAAIVKSIKESLSKKSRKPRKRVKEDLNEVTVTTDDTHMEMSTDENGKVTVTTEPVNKVEDAEAIIAPLDDETKSEIENNDIEGEEEVEVGEDEVEADIDEFDTDNFDELGESFLKKSYNNVDAFKTTGVKVKNNSIKVEGLISFKSGAKKKTHFVFEAKDMSKRGKYRLIGENLQLSRGHKSFTVIGTINNKKFVSESLNYNYRASDANGKSQRVSGTVRVSKK